MHQQSRLTIGAFGLITATVLLTACSGSSTSASGGARSTPGSTSPSRGHSTEAPPSSTGPAATEVNPPGDIPDNQVFVSYRAPGAPFTVKVPEGWARSSSGGAVVFTDKLNSIAISSRPLARPPTVAIVRTSELPPIQQRGGNYHAQGVTTVRRKAGMVVLASYLQDSQPDAVTGKVVRDAVERYSFWSNGTEAVLTLSGPKGADNVDPWRIVSDSVTWH